MYKFELRKGHGSSKLLIEINSVNSSASEVNREKIIDDFQEAIESINPFMLSSTDLWMSDEIVYYFMSHIGEFELSIDNWGFIFIMADKNQPAIKIIATLLDVSNLFIANQKNT